MRRQMRRIARRRDAQVLDAPGHPDNAARWRMAVELDALRCHRVGLGEIERPLRALGGVQECIAVATPDAVFPNPITAFVTADHPDDVEEPPDLLRVRLPRYMIPRRTLPVTDNPPRNSNREVDGKTLAGLAGQLTPDEIPSLTITR